MKSTSKTFRSRHRYHWFPGFMGAMCVLGLIVLLNMSYTRAQTPWRQTIAFVSDVSMYIVSWDAPKTRAVVLEVPTSTVIEATHGYGAYAIGSLHALDAIDGKRGHVFVDSVSDAFGIPVSGVVSIPGSGYPAGSIEFLRRVFSWKSVLSAHQHGSIGVSHWIPFVWATMRLKTDDVEVKSIKGTLVSQTRPDGSVIDVLDPQRFDYLFDRVFVDSGIRQEEVSVAVYNTTEIPTVGTRAARMLTTYGASVVTVGNDTNTPLQECQVRGTKAHVASRTARFIQQYFHCQTAVVESETQGGAELVLLLGTSYADQFAPKK